MTQTQMSVIFFSDNLVYKIKKPVNLGYLDYTTLEKRLFFCRKELELNRRLCPDYYLEVVNITSDNGKIHVNGKGQIIEYAVKMKRLPEESMMNVLLEKNMVTPEMIEAVADRIVKFHKTAETSADISSSGGLETVVTNTEENFDQTVKYIGQTITPEQYESIQAYTRDFIESNRSLFHKRVNDGKIKDCHGDLHAAHICFVDDICIYDCIEFNDRFRYVDVAAEVSFLAMDLDNYGYPELSNAFVNAYIQRSQDNEISELLRFYKCYFAYVRGKVACFKIDDPLITEEEREKTKGTARKYFKLATTYAQD